MKIAIFRKEENIVTIKDYSDIGNKGEISHILMELEFIKEDLKELWKEVCDGEEG